MMRCKIHLGFILLAYITNSSLHAQALRYEHFGTNEGLPSSQVFDIIQDDWGYLWLSTDHGLSRFNGYSFENYSMQDGLTDNTVFNFLKHEGDIWCSTNNRSLFSIHGADPVFKPYSHNAKIMGLSPGIFVTTSFYLSPKNHLYMSFVNGLGFIRVDEKGEVISYIKKKPYKKSDNLTSIAIDEQGRSFFFCSGTKLIDNNRNWQIEIKNAYLNATSDYVKAVYLPGKKTAIFTSKQFIDIVSNGKKPLHIPTEYEPIGVGKYDHNSFWVGFRYGGMCIYNIHGKMMRRFLDGKTVTGCYRDHEGGLWMSTMHDGAYYIKDMQIQSVDFADNREKWVNRMTRDNDGNIWAGMYNGDVYKINKERSELIHRSVVLRPALVDYNRFTKEVIYFSDEQVLYNVSNNPFFKLRYGIINVSSFGKDTIILSTYSGIGVLVHLKETFIVLNKRVHDVVNWNDQFVLATMSGLVTWKPKENKISAGSLKSLRISDLEFVGNRLALGTQGTGLVIINPDSSLLKIGRLDGLNSDFVSQLFAENDSTIWVCTNAGINRIILHQHRIEIKGMSTKDGLLSNEVTDIEVINGTVWVGTREGLCYFRSSYIDHLQSSIKEDFLRFTNIKINDQHRKIQKVYYLSHNENRIEIEFQAISFRRRNGLEYRYKLVGLEQNWNYTTDRKVVYTSIPPGTYELEVQTLGTNHRWEIESIKMTLFIQPPFWKTWWFILLVVAGIIVLVYLFFRFRILSYNRDITRELLRQLLKKIRRKEKYIIYREQGKDIRIPTSAITYVKSSGNYLEIYTEKGKHIVRSKIGEFLDTVPDPLEFMRVHRSYIVRLDKVEQKGAREVVVMGEKIAVGETYIKDLQKIQF